MDFFGQNITFNEDGKPTYTTNFGALVTMLIVILVGIYSVDKMYVLMQFRDSSLT